MHSTVYAGFLRRLSTHMVQSEAQVTQVSAGVFENATGDLCTADGTVIVPKEKRQKTEVYSRIVGYLRPVSGWNKGKRQEFKDRAVFQVKIESPEPAEEHDS